MILASVFPGTGRVVAYKPDVALMLDDVNQALMLCQLLFWSGKEWEPGSIIKSQEEMQFETGLTRSQQETARRGLCKKGFMAVTKKKCPPVLHYHLDIEAIKAAWRAFLEERTNAALQEQEKQGQNGRTNLGKVATRAAINQRIERRKQHNQVATEEAVVLREIVESNRRNSVDSSGHVAVRFAGNRSTIYRDNDRDHTREDAREAKMNEEIAPRPFARRRRR